MSMILRGPVLCAVLSRLALLCSPMHCMAKRERRKKKKGKWRKKMRRRRKKKRKKQQLFFRYLFYVLFFFYTGRISKSKMLSTTANN